jgi:hypothetical protein
MTPLYSLHVIHPPRMTTNCPDYLSIYLSIYLLQSPRFFLDHKYLTENKMKLFLSWKDFLIVENVKDIFLVIPMFLLISILPNWSQMWNPCSLLTSAIWQMVYTKKLKIKKWIFMLKSSWSDPPIFFPTAGCPPECVFSFCTTRSSSPSSTTPV